MGFGLFQFGRILPHRVVVSHHLRSILGILQLVCVLSLFSLELSAQPVFKSEGSVPLAFTVDTNAGEISGTIDLVRLSIRAIDGVGRFRMDAAFDPMTIRTGDAVRDKVIQHLMLQSNKGLIHYASTNRVAVRHPPEGWDGSNPLQYDIPPEGYQVIRAGIWSDALRGTAYSEMTYFWKPNPNGSVHIMMQEVVPLDKLGFTAVRHPFVHLTGALHLKLDTTVWIR